VYEGHPTTPSGVTTPTLPFVSCLVVLFDSSVRCRSTARELHPCGLLRCKLALPLCSMSEAGLVIGSMRRHCMFLSQVLGLSTPLLGLPSPLLGLRTPLLFSCEGS
jgi:hypothetical protein